MYVRIETNVDKECREDIQFLWFRRADDWNYVASVAVQEVSFRFYDVVVDDASASNESVWDRRIILESNHDNKVLVVGSTIHGLLNRSNNTVLPSFWY